MTISQPVPPAPMTPWMRYVYDDIAYMTHNGRLIAWASVATPTKETRIDLSFAQIGSQFESVATTTCSIYSGYATTCRKCHWLS